MRNAGRLTHYALRFTDRDILERFVSKAPKDLLNSKNNVTYYILLEIRIVGLIKSYQSKLAQKVFFLIL